MMLAYSRWMMLLLAGTLVLGCNQPTGALSLPAAVGRPADVSQGPRVGVIVAQGGGVTIVPSKGQAFQGLPDQQLLRDDSLVTAADSFVVVQLHNQHLVRLGANQRNVVEMLAPFHDPPAGDDIEARFVRLLSPEERDDPALRGAIARVAGWNTRMSAAQTFAALPASEAPQRAPEAPAPTQAPSIEQSAADGLQRGGDSPIGGVPSIPEVLVEEERVDEKKRGGPTDAPPPPPASPASKRKEAPERDKASRSAPATDSKRSTDADDAESAEGAPGSSAPAPAPEPAPKPGPSAPQLPKQLRFTPASGGPAKSIDLPTPFKANGAALASCAGAGAKISGRVKDHKLVALAVDGAAKCQALVGQASTLADGSFELIVTP